MEVRPGGWCLREHILTSGKCNDEHRSEVEIWAWKALLPCAPRLFWSGTYPLIYRVSIGDFRYCSRRYPRLTPP